MKPILLLLVLSLFILPVASQASCVKGPRANLRKGPGTKYSKSWEVYKYMPFKILKRKGLWAKVSDVDGETHWIHRKLVTDSYKCAVIKTEKANLRTGPGTRYRKEKTYGTAEKYMSFRLLKTKGNWAKVQDEYGDSMWVHRSLIWIR